MPDEHSIPSGRQMFLRVIETLALLFVVVRLLCQCVIDLVASLWTHTRLALEEHVDQQHLSEKRHEPNSLPMLPRKLRRMRRA
jgi:hypothetical protein